MRPADGNADRDIESGAPLPAGAEWVQETDDPLRFEDALKPLYRPAAIRGLAAQWPIVRAGRKGVAELARYLGALDSGSPTTVYMAPPEMRGRYFYAPDMRGFNFTSRKMPLSELLDLLLAERDRSDPQGLYAGSTPVADSLPAFSIENQMPLDVGGGEARIWIGNASQIATHYDMAANLAVVVAGSRRFTLFPPEQIANLYVGPVDRTVAGQPTSMVHPLAPDLARYPRFAEAQRHALVADLAPGDALYIPPMWWHHVQATAPLNVLVNYWHAQSPARSPFAALMHAVHSIRELPEPERAAWRSWFDHYVFGPGAGQAVDHLPGYARGALGPAAPQRDKMIRDYVVGLLRS